MCFSAIKNEIEEKEKVALEKYKSEDEGMIYQISAASYDTVFVFFCTLNMLVYINCNVERKKKQQEEDMAQYMAAEKEQATQNFRLLDKNGDGKYVTESRNRFSKLFLAALFCGNRAKTGYVHFSRFLGISMEISWRCFPPEIYQCCPISCPNIGIRANITNFSE